jgi:SpoVK/Ycf46/Vps4 family AAA+-type ATPase
MSTKQKNKRPVDAQKDQWNMERNEKHIQVYVYSEKEQKWTELPAQPSRDFSSIILPELQKSSLISDLNKFINSEAKYKQYNIPFRRGYFLYGPPGTGKTSIATAVGSTTNRPIYLMPINITQDVIRLIPKNSVILFEDADKMISTEETKYREIDTEPIPLTTSYPTINESEHNIWLRAIRNNECVINQFKNDYAGLEANYDRDAAGGISLMDSVVEGVLTSMKAGYAEPRKGRSSKAVDVDVTIEYEPAETEEEFKERRNMYKNIIREVNKLRQEHYDATRFDQKKINLLLQFLDGKLTPYGSIFIMTTNYHNDIHSTLLRMGRMDVKVEINYMSAESIDVMLNRFNVPEDKKEFIISKVRIPGRANNVTAAELQGAIVEHIF